MARVLIVEGDRQIVDESGEVIEHHYQAGRVWHLGAVLTIASDEFRHHGGGVVLLTVAGMAEMGLGLVPPNAAEAANALVLGSARARGWNVTKLAPWMSFYSDNGSWPRIAVACLPWLRSSSGPLWRESTPAAEFARSLADYHEVMGTRFYATPGVTGLEVLRTRTRLSEEPYWCPKDFYGVGRVPRGTRHAEDDYRVWTAPSRSHEEEPLAFEHTYDAVSQYLAVAGSVYLPVGELAYAVGGEFDPRRGGYYQIELPVWNLDYLPHPAGNHREGVGPVWVTAPTMALLHELAEYGVIAAPVVLSSWTASTLRVLRTWQELTRDALRMAIGERFGPEVRRAVKSTYTEAIGLMGREGGRVFRPDWRHALIASARCNLFRKMFAIAQQEGRYPVRIKVDAITYASDEFDPVAAAPQGLSLVVPGAEAMLGKFRYSALPPVRVSA